MCTFSVVNKDSFEAAKCFDKPFVMNFANAFFFVKIILTTMQTNQILIRRSLYEKNITNLIGIIDN